MCSSDLFGDLQAYAKQIVLVATGPDSAIAQQIAVLNASLADKADATALSTLSTEVTTQGGLIEANSEALTSVSVKVDGVSAGGLISITANTNPPDGILSQVDIGARAEVGGAVALAADSYQVYDDNGTLRTRRLTVADQFVVTDGTNTGSPLAFIDSVLTLQDLVVDGALIKNATITNAKRGPLLFGRAA